MYGVEVTAATVFDIFTDGEKGQYTKDTDSRNNLVGETAMADWSSLVIRRITAVRNAYQGGVMNPMFHIDTLWKDYIAIKQNINPIIAEKMVQDRSRYHMNARRVAKEWEVTVRGLNRFWPATPSFLTLEESKHFDT